MPEKKKSAIQDFQSELEIADAQSPDFANLDGEAKKYQKQIDAHTWPKGKTLKEVNFARLQTLLGAKLKESDKKEGVDFAFIKFLFKLSLYIIDPEKPAQQKQLQEKQLQQNINSLLKKAELAIGPEHLHARALCAEVPKTDRIKLSNLANIPTIAGWVHGKKIANLADFSTMLDIFEMLVSFDKIDVEMSKEKFDHNAQLVLSRAIIEEDVNAAKRIISLFIKEKCPSGEGAKKTLQNFIKGLSENRRASNLAGAVGSHRGGEMLNFLFKCYCKLGVNCDSVGKGEITPLSLVMHEFTTLNKECNKKRLQGKLVEDDNTATRIKLAWQALRVLLQEGGCEVENIAPKEYLSQAVNQAANDAIETIIALNKIKDEDSAVESFYYMVKKNVSNLVDPGMQFSVAKSEHERPVKDLDRSNQDELEEMCRVFHPDGFAYYEHYKDRLTDTPDKFNVTDARGALLALDENVAILQELARGMCADTSEIDKAIDKAIVDEYLETKEAIQNAKMKAQSAVANGMGFELALAVRNRIGVIYANIDTSKNEENNIRLNLKIGEIAQIAKSLNGPALVLTLPLVETSAPYFVKNKDDYCKCLSDMVVHFLDMKYTDNFQSILVQTAFLRLKNLAVSRAKVSANLKIATKAKDKEVANIILANTLYQIQTGKSLTGFENPENATRQILISQIDESDFEAVRTTIHPSKLTQIFNDRIFRSPEIIVRAVKKVNLAIDELARAQCAEKFNNQELLEKLSNYQRSVKTLATLTNHWQASGEQKEAVLQRVLEDIVNPHSRCQFMQSLLDVGFLDPKTTMSFAQGHKAELSDKDSSSSLKKLRNDCGLLSPDMEIVTTEEGPVILELIKERCSNAVEYCNVDHLNHFLATAKKIFSARDFCNVIIEVVTFINANFEASRVNLVTYCLLRNLREVAKESKDLNIKDLELRFIQQIFETVKLDDVMARFVLEESGFNPFAPALPFVFNGYSKSELEAGQATSLTLRKCEISIFEHAAMQTPSFENSNHLTGFLKYLLNPDGAIPDDVKGKVIAQAGKIINLTNSYNDENFAPILEGLFKHGYQLPKIDPENSRDPMSNILASQNHDAIRVAKGSYCPAHGNFDQVSAIEVLKSRGIFPYGPMIEAITEKVEMAKPKEMKKTKNPIDVSRKVSEKVVEKSLETGRVIEGMIAGVIANAVAQAEEKKAAEEAAKTAFANEDVKAEIVRMKAELAAAKAETEAAKSEADKAKAEAAAAENRASQAEKNTKEGASAMAKLQKLEDEKVKLELVAKTAHLAAKNIAKNLEEFKSENDTLREQIAQLQENAKSSGAAKNEDKHSVLPASRSNERPAKRLANARAQIRDLKTQMQELEEEMTRLRHELTQAQAAKEEANPTQEAYDEALANILANHDQELKRSRQEAFDRGREEEAREHSGFEVRVERTSVNLDPTAERLIRSYKEAAEKAKQEQENLGNEVGKMQNTINQLMQQLDAAAMSNAGLQNRLTMVERAFTAQYQSQIMAAAVVSTQQNWPAAGAAAPVVDGVEPETETYSQLSEEKVESSTDVNPQLAAKETAPEVTTEEGAAPEVTTEEGAAQEGEVTTVKTPPTRKQTPPPSRSWADMAEEGVDFEKDPFERGGAKIESGGARSPSPTTSTPKSKNLMPDFAKGGGPK